MDTFHPTPVVPSNAPPWTDLDHDSKVLREDCVNRQLGYVQTQDNDYFANIGDDSTCGSTEARVSAYQPLQFGHGIPGRPHYPWMSGLVQSNNNNNEYDLHNQNIFNNVGSGKVRGPLGLGMYPSLAQDEKDRIAETNARHLAARFSRCEGYVKYRKGQPKERKNNKGEAVWPDIIEDAFIIALCRHPPCGRTQEIAPNEEHRENAKPLGRNELISNYILRNTGYVRDRKQVSSHIQVIKPFVLKEAIIMRMLVTPDKKSKGSKAARKKASKYNPGPLLRIGGINQQHRYPLHTAFNLEPEEFCMFMRSLNTSETLHTYSATGGVGPSRFYVQTEAQLYDCFPGLANVPLERFVTGKFLALHVPIVLHPKPLAGGTEMAIRWSFKAPDFHPHVSVSSRTRFYLLGQPIYCDKDGNRQFYDTSDLESTEQMQDDWNSLTKEYDAAEVSDHSDGLEVDSNGNYTSGIKNEEGRMVRYYVPFSSTFWARYLFHVAYLKRQIGDLKTRPLQAAEDRDYLIHEKQRDVSSSLDDLIAVQEIIARTDVGEPQVVLTVHFTFSHSDEVAPTTWQYVDMTSMFSDDTIAPPLSTGGQMSQQSASDSQESALSVQDTFGGGSHDYSNFDFSASSLHHHQHQQPQHHTGYHDTLESHAITDLASPIDLHDTQASAADGYNTSWLLQPTPDHHLPSTILDPLLPHHASQHDVNAFDFTNGNISISLDSSALSPHQHHLPHHISTSASSSFSSAVNALDHLDLTAVSNTDPSLLLLKAPERTNTPWLLTSTANATAATNSPSAATTSTTTDYAALFSHANSPSTSHTLYPDYGVSASTSADKHANRTAEVEAADLEDHLAAAALPENFEIMSTSSLGMVHQQQQEQQQQQQSLLPFPLIGDSSQLQRHGLHGQHHGQHDYRQHTRHNHHGHDEYQHDQHSQLNNDYRHSQAYAGAGAGNEIDDVVIVDTTATTTTATATGFEDFNVNEVNTDFGTGFE